MSKVHQCHIPAALSKAYLEKAGKHNRQKHSLHTLRLSQKDLPQSENLVHCAATDQMFATLFIKNNCKSSKILVWFPDKIFLGLRGPRGAPGQAGRCECDPNEVERLNAKIQILEGLELVIKILIEALI